MTRGAPAYLLCADDFALTPGVSAAIGTLAEAGRLSATSAMVTRPAWADCDAGQMRTHVSLGLHVDLTLGPPLAPLPRGGGGDGLPAIGTWIRRAWTGRIDTGWVEAEIERQFARFEAIAGAPPDHVDGHHHVHLLPGIRTALLRVIARRAPAAGLPLVRNPGDRAARLVRRGHGIGKAAIVALATGGGARALSRNDVPRNDSFAGFSGFDRGRRFADELSAFERAPGRQPMVMCHPGHADAALARLDPVAERREDEFRCLIEDADLPARILHPARYRDTAGRIDWQRVFAG